MACPQSDQRRRPGATDEGFTQPRSYVEVDSIDDALKVAVDKGGAVLRGKEPINDSSWWAVFADPDGNAIGLYESTPAT